MSDKPIVGFIGVGLMGHGMAKNIKTSGYELWYLDQRPIDSLLKLGAREAASAKDMAQKCDIIHICLQNSGQVESVIRGDNGILAGARPGLIVIDTSTSDPASTLKLVEEVKGKGISMIDASLGRTPKEAEEGTLDAMVAGDDEIFERVRPVIECWAGRTIRVGAVGNGHKMKLLMNFIGMSYGALYAEAVVLSAKIGISPQTLREVIAPSRMGSGFFDTFMKYVVERDRDAHKFAISFAAKDLRYVNNMAAESKMMSIMASAAVQYYAHAESTGHGGDYVPMLSDLVGALNGVDMAEEVRKGAHNVAP
ncbi:NAD(P)-dependent oxidoreductase [Rhizobium ruizarguesonis]|uniref:NAD(P)-dependent oxidoreductase n=1 Tax=Rhizobium TaxID=379 RepID=UPI0013C06A3A|nr:NAD(P)-dependent oxidoreductase [Rhizobium ruizarguesonis]NEI96564.1 NAD-binding protein [Rhizobium ruizarguesonis]NEJ33813.1 NAD-binding protein [Rhizobium ruizarguesonis]